MDELEAAIAAEPWLPGDHIGRVWPSDQIHNFSADGRAMGKLSAKVFRDTLGRLASPSKEEPSDA